MINTVLFDLDGTLLPMDLEEFINTYMGLLAQKMAPQGYESRHLVAGIWAATHAMMENDGSRTNEAVFWEDFCRIFGPQARRDEPLFEEFYATDFAQARTVCGFAPEAARIVRFLKEKGVTVAVATQPLFPAIATRQRIRWAGLEPEDFAAITSYETSCYSKPSPDFYRELLDRLGRSPETCLMVGNDMDEDMRPAREAGMQTFLLTDCLIDRGGPPVDCPRGGFAELEAFLRNNI